MYSKLLVPLDGSRLSEGILPHARSLAKALSVPLELLQVIDWDAIPAITDPQFGRYIDTAKADMKKNSIDYLNSVAGSFLKSLNVTRSVEIGNTAEVIVDRAASQSGTLIAMSTHGRSGLQRWVLGSIAAKVLHTATNPILLVRATKKRVTNKEVALKMVLVPLDGSALAEQVLTHITTLAKKMMLKVVLLRVYDVSGDTPHMQKITKIVRDASRTYLEEKVGLLRGEGLEKVSYLLLKGRAAGRIVDIARETPDNLVAMCTHGRSGIGRWVLGSVTDRVVRHCGDPVLVIRAAAESG